MREFYDFSKGVRNPDAVEKRRKRIKENGYRITVTDGDKIVERRFISPEEAAAEIIAADKCREEWRRQNCI